MLFTNSIIASFITFLSAPRQLSELEILNSSNKPIKIAPSNDFLRPPRDRLKHQHDINHFRNKVFGWIEARVIKRGWCFLFFFRLYRCLKHKLINKFKLKNFSPFLFSFHLILFINWTSFWNVKLFIHFSNKRRA